jgi:hypothetical protein
MRFVARILAAGLLAAGLAPVMPAVTASASSGITIEYVTYTGTDWATYGCESGNHTYNGTSGYYVAYVSNGCGYRLWLHGTLSGGGASYCVNPWALAYGISGSYEQFQAGTNPYDCDSGTQMSVTWSDYDGKQYYTTSPYYCHDGDHYNLWNGSDSRYYQVDTVTNTCNVRIWLHENPDGSGNAYCISPNTTVGIYPGQVGPFYEQFQISGNQAPCSAG